MARRREIAHALADAFLAGEWSAAAMLARAQQTLGAQPPWLVAAIEAARRGFSSPPWDGRDDLARRLLRDDQFGRAFGEPPERPTIRHRFIPPSAMGSRRWPVPPLPTVRDLQQWLGVEGSEFDWFVDRKGLERFVPAGPLRHYRYHWMQKRLGGWRLIEQPKVRLKEIQRRILHGILDRIPPHEAAHGFREGRSVRSFALPHVGRSVVLRLDLSDFFGTITIARVFRLFRTAGYPESVARALAALCTNRVPRGELRMVEVDWTTRRRLQTPHLPQGASTSPALANLIAFRLDMRLSALATASGLRYTRYADDLAFSTSEARSLDRFTVQAAAIALEEGFQVNFRKLRTMGAARTQHLAGLVVNARTNVPRYDFDTLKAILHNCAKHGPASQNRESHPHFREHLLGRLSWVESVNPTRGARLRTVWAQIDWSR